MYKQNKKGKNNMPSGFENGNYNNLINKLAVVYGDRTTPSKALKEMIAKYKAVNGEDSVRTVGNEGEYNYGVQFLLGKEWVNNPDQILKMNAEYALDKPGSDTGNKDEAAMLREGVDMSRAGVERRFARAFNGGDVAKGKETLAQAIANFKKEHPDRFREENGKIQIKIGGDWKTDADSIALTLGRFAPGVQLKENKEGKKILPGKISGILDGANGNGLFIRFISMYGQQDDATAKQIAQRKLDAALASFKKSGGDFKIHGSPGEPSYFIEITTKGGNRIVETDKILEKLEEHLPESGKRNNPYFLADDPTKINPLTPPATNNPNTEKNNPGSGTNSIGLRIPENWGRGIFANPGAQSSVYDEWTAVNNAAMELDYLKDLVVAQDLNTTTKHKAAIKTAEMKLNSALRAYDEATSGSISRVATMVNNKSGSSELDESKNALALSQQLKEEKKEFKRAKDGSFVEVDLGEAAKKSKALMAADLNDNDKVSKREAAVLAPADKNKDGVVGINEVKAFTAAADTNNTGKVSLSESKAFNVLDTNNNGKINQREVKAYNSIDTNNDGDITKKEAKAALAAQIDNKKLNKAQDDLAKQYLAKAGNKGGGAQQVDEQVAALVNSQQKYDNQPKKEGPGANKKKG